MVLQNTNDIASLSGRVANSENTIISLSGTVDTISTSVSTLQSQVATLLSSMHDPVTLGMSNGLSLSGQELSLVLA